MSRREFLPERLFLRIGARRESGQRFPSLSVQAFTRKLIADLSRSTGELCRSDSGDFGACSVSEPSVSVHRNNTEGACSVAKFGDESESVEVHGRGESPDGHPGGILHPQAAQKAQDLRPRA